MINKGGGTPQNPQGTTPLVRGLATKTSSEFSTPPGVCLGCGAPAASRRATGPAPSYCSKSCQNSASYRRRKEAGTIKLPSRKADLQLVCTQCGERFCSRRPARFCSRSCADRARDDQASECSAAACSSPVRAKGLCAKHWRRQARAEGREQPPAWDESRRAAWKAREELKRAGRQVEVEPIVPQMIFVRDGWICGLCFEPVDESLVWPHPSSASVDHIIPLSRGGSHTAANVQLAHLRCNLSKGSRVA